VHASRTVLQTRTCFPKADLAGASREYVIKEHSFVCPLAQCSEMEDGDQILARHHFEQASMLQTQSCLRVYRPSGLAVKALGGNDYSGVIANRPELLFMVGTPAGWLLASRREQLASVLAMQQLRSWIAQRQKIPRAHTTAQSIPVLAETSTVRARGRAHVAVQKYVSACSSEWSAVRCVDCVDRYLLLHTRHVISWRNAIPGIGRSIQNRNDAWSLLPDLSAYFGLDMSKFCASITGVELGGTSLGFCSA